MERWRGLKAYDGKIYGHQGNGCDGFAVYDIASNTWTELPNVPDGAVLGSELEPVSGTYYAYGNYGGSSFYEYSIASNSWTTITFPFTDINDGGMALVQVPGLEGVYVTYGQNSTGFTRFVTPAPVADLSITKAASASSVKTGTQITYTLHVKNAGPSDSGSGGNVVVSDHLPSNVTFVSASTTKGTCSGTTTVTCRLGTVGSGVTVLSADSITITIKVTAKTAGTATNTATVSSPTSDSNTGNNHASATTAIVSPVKPLKSLRLTVSPRSVAAGHTVCFSFRATSSGHGVSGVTVRFAGHTAHTSHSGRARICVSLRRGSYHARATKRGYHTTRATVVARSAPHPVFTG